MNQFFLELLVVTTMCGAAAVVRAEKEVVSPLTDDAEVVDMDLTECDDPLCQQGHGWEVIQGAPKPIEVDPSAIEDFGVRMITTNDVHLNRTYEDGYSIIVEFGGYSSTHLCTRYTRTAPIDGHTKCPLKRDWYQMWPPAKSDACFVDDIRAYQQGNKLNSPPSTEIVMNKCPAPGADPADGKWHGGYDWRYGSIRPQDNPSMALYPQIAEHIEDAVIKTGKRVVIRGCSGGTINGYAFIMSQTKEWRDKNILAFVAVSPVFGGTVSSLHSVLAGWKSGGMDICSGRAAALYIPSVYWMWPHPGDGPGQWNSTEVVVTTPKKNYTAYDFDEMLTDMGCGKGPKELYDLEKADLLGKFPAPLVDTYVFYGYGLPTQAGFGFQRELEPETDGEAVCPPNNGKAFVREWDNGDVTAPLRSCRRADAWEAEHKKAGKVLHNVGYKGMSHGCACKTKQCTADYTCILNKLAGKPHAGC